MKKIGVFVAVFTALFVLFFWYGYRPSEIKKSCYKEAISLAQKEFINEGPSNLVPVGSEKTSKEIFDENVEKGTYQNSDFDSYYSKCLLKEGL